MLENSQNSDLGHVYGTIWMKNRNVQLCCYVMTYFRIYPLFRFSNKYNQIKINVLQLNNIWYYLLHYCFYGKKHRFCKKWAHCDGLWYDNVPACGHRGSKHEVVHEWKLIF